MWLPGGRRVGVCIIAYKYVFSLSAYVCVYQRTAGSKDSSMTWPEGKEDSSDFAANEVQMGIFLLFSFNVVHSCEPRSEQLRSHSSLHVSWRTWGFTLNPCINKVWGIFFNMEKPSKGDITDNMPR